MRKQRSASAKPVRLQPKVDLSDSAKDAAVACALAEAERALGEAQKTYPKRKLAVNVFGANTGSEGYSIEEEGTKSTLIARGYHQPAIMAPSSPVMSPGAWRPPYGCNRSA